MGHLFTAPFPEAALCNLEERQAGQKSDSSIRTGYLSASINIDNEHTHTQARHHLTSLLRREGWRQIPGISLTSLWHSHGNMDGGSSQWSGCEPFDMTEWERDGRQRCQISEPLILNPVTGLHCLVSSNGASIWREMSLQLWQMCEMPLSVYDGAADVWECLVHMIMVFFWWWKKNSNWLEIIKHTQSLLISAYWKQKKEKGKVCLQRNL